MDNSPQEYNSWIWASMQTLENPASDGIYSIETLHDSLYQQSLMLLPNSPALESSMQVDNRSVDYLDEEMVQGSDDSSYREVIDDVIAFFDTLPSTINQGMVEGPNASSYREDVIQDMLAFYGALPSTINEGMVEGPNDSSFREDVVEDMIAFCDTLPSTINQGIQDHESVHHFQLEEVESPSDFPFSRPNEAKDGYNTSGFRSPLEEMSLDHWGSKTAGGRPCYSISGPDEGERLEASSDDISQLSDMMGCTRDINPYDISIEELDRVEHWETSPKIKFYFDDMLAFTGSTLVASSPDFLAMVTEELQMIVITIAGKAFYQKMEKAGSPILPLLQSSLHTTLQELKPEKGLEVTLKIVRKEACKWMYSFMRNSNQKIAAHPEHIKEIPRNWLVEHGNLYPLEDQYSKIAEEMGLEKKQVVNVFENARKRTFKSMSGLDANLKSHFSPDITKIFRKWQFENGGKQPDPKSRQELMDQTNCSKTQIVDWFNNHKPGRDRSNKRARPL